MCYTNRLFFFSCVAVYINSALSFVPEVRNTVINLLLLGSKPKFRNFEEFLVHEEDDDQTGNFAVVVLFTNPYCGPCLKIKDELTTVNRKLKGRINLVAIDTDRYPSLGTRYNITGERNNRLHYHAECKFIQRS